MDPSKFRKLRFYFRKGDQVFEVDVWIMKRKHWLASPESKDPRWQPAKFFGYTIALRLELSPEVSRFCDVVMPPRW